MPTADSPQRARGRRVAVVALVLAALFLMRPVLGTRGPHLRLTTLDVGHGLATLVELPNGATLLFDAGGGSLSSDVGANVIAPVLWSRDIPRIDALVLSHNHWDHCGGVAGLLDRFPVKRCFLNRFFGEAPLGAEVLRTLTQAGVPVDQVSADDQIRLDDSVTLRVLNPPTGPLAGILSTNDASVALLLEYGRQRVLLLADVAGGWLRPLLERVGGPVDVLLVPHHGLGDVALEEVLELARPRYALISSGWGERQELARRALEAAGATTLVTYERGAITLELDGREVQVSTFRAAAAEHLGVAGEDEVDELAPIPEEQPE